MMKHIYIGVISTITMFILLFLLFFITKGNYFWTNTEEGLIFFIPVWSIIIGVVSYYLSFKYSQAKNIYLNAGKENQWPEYKIYLIVKYSFLFAKVFLLGLPIAILDFYFKDGEVLGTNIPMLCFLFIAGFTSAIIYLLFKKKLTQY